MRKIILFVDPDSGPRGRLFLQRVQQQLSGARVQVCMSVENCVAALRRIRPGMNPPIVVLFVAGKKSLDQVYTKKQLLEDKKIVMVLPEENTDDCTALIYKFFPRYVAFMDDRYDDLCDVLNKMMVQ
jgi:hypothetical protein